MRLSPNVIRQLELFRPSEDTHRGSLVWLLGANVTTAGGAASPPLGRAPADERLRDPRAARRGARARRTAEPDSGGRLDAAGGAAAVPRRSATRSDWRACSTARRLPPSWSRPERGARVRGRRRGWHGPQTNRATNRSKGFQVSLRTAYFPFRCVPVRVASSRPPAEASDEETAAGRALLLSAVDAEARSGAPRPPPRSLTPRASPSWRRRARRSRRRSGTRGFFPSCANTIRWAPGLRRGADGVGSRKTLFKNVVASRAATAKLGYVTVALVEHLIEPRTGPRAPHDWVRSARTRARGLCGTTRRRCWPRRRERARERHVRAWRPPGAIS